LLAVLLVCCIRGDAKEGSQQNGSGVVSTDTARTVLSAGAGATTGIVVLNSVVGGVAAIGAGAVAVMPALLAMAAAGSAGVAAYYATGMVYDATSYVFKKLQKYLQQTLKSLDKVYSGWWHNARSAVFNNDEIIPDAVRADDKESYLKQYFEDRTSLSSAISSYKDHEQTCLAVASTDERSECIREGKNLQAEVKAARDFVRAQRKVLQSTHGYSEKDIDHLYKKHLDKLKDRDDENFDFP
jgi:hypothetical protein